MEHNLWCVTFTASKSESNWGSCPFSLDTLMDNSSIHSHSSFSSQSELLCNSKEFGSAVISIPKLWMVRSKDDSTKLQ